jgi:hypothetical protein
MFAPGLMVTTLAVTVSRLMAVLAMATLAVTVARLMSVVTIAMPVLTMSVPTIAMTLIAIVVVLPIVTMTVICKGAEREGGHRHDDVMILMGACRSACQHQHKQAARGHHLQFVYALLNHWYLRNCLVMAQL